MKKGLAISLLIVGIMLILWGVSASDSISSDVSQIFTGAPSSKTVWLLIPGIIAAVIGAAGMLRGTKAE